MGRGLSPLQRRILSLAGENQGLTSYRDVMVSYFGWKLRRVGKAAKRRRQRWEKRESGPVEYKTKSQWFDEEAIGWHCYRAAIASLSRACSRLGSRGLIYRPQRRSGVGKCQSAIHLTDAGRALMGLPSEAEVAAKRYARLKAEKDSASCSVNH
jgi:hypothetical protein